MKADRNGFFFVANRETGKVLSAEPFVPTTWATKWDITTASAVEDRGQARRPGSPAKGVCPNLIGGKNWQPMSYNPGDGPRLYPVQQSLHGLVGFRCQYKRGIFYLGGEFPPVLPKGGYLGELMAWDPVKHEKAWGIKEDLPFNGGTLDDRGNLVFAGNQHGDFRRSTRPTARSLAEEPRFRHRRRADHLFGERQAVCRYGRRAHGVVGGVPRHRSAKDDGGDSRRRRVVRLRDRLKTSEGRRRRCVSVGL